ncbi:MAG: regulatory protein RecX [Motilibacteraceae bacterium]
MQDEDEKPSRRPRGRREGRRQRWRPGDDGPPPGSPVTADPEPDPESVARAICLRQLTMGPRTRAQLAEAMAKREVPDAVAERVLDRFTEVKLIDDAAFAQAWVRSRHDGRGLARRALAQELRTKGVEDGLAREALDQLDPEQERETAGRLVRARLASTRGLEYPARVRRLAGLLARKGYPGGLALSVVRAELAAEGDPDGADGADGPDGPDGVDGLDQVERFEQDGS